ncbi:MAG: hypothetical protein GOVbin8609_34 [Prokaryotic dsDNA virus sp.]|nr:MAG: hypothetical protein GOVbin8609_34 [Prokaryotic dsDNA virus sp.]|tara:strand:+ start:29182 stop:29643 length:462 start_codon:yes stop_codon:yes gene_type:complete
MSKMTAKIKKSPNKAIKKLEEIAKQMKGDNLVKVGLPKGSNNYPDGTSVIMVGNVHEFGSPSRGVPERSFLRSTLNEKSGKYKNDLKKLGKKVLLGEMTSEQSLQMLGLMASSDVKDKITDIKEPALTSREGNPLVDTGHLRQSITYEVGNAD